MLPSLLLVVYAFILVRSGAWSHPPDWTAAVDAFFHIGVGGTVLLIVLGMALGLGTHPLQFGLVQFLEGYWGTSRIARKARSVMITHHRNRASALEGKDVEGDQEAGRLLALYPHDPDLVMPTRLGNVLRRYEMLAGRQYELRVLTVLPHMALAARPEDARYLDDQRLQLDLAVRMCLTAVLAAFISAVLLYRDEWWLFIVIVPCCLAYIAYRGAVVSAREYGVAMTTLIDLNRFALYERLHLPKPSNIEEERKNNRRVMNLMEANSQHIFIRYEDPSASISGQSQGSGGQAGAAMG
jgi:hypothetical protein